MSPIEEIQKHIQEFISKPHPVFNNIPICPYAGGAKIKFIVQELTDDIVEHCHWLQEYEAIIVIHPTKDGISFHDLESLVNRLNASLVGYSAFSGHPLHEFQVGGLYTRREPFPNVQIISSRHVLEASACLHNTGYYKNWTQDNLNYVRTNEA